MSPALTSGGAAQLVDALAERAEQDQQLPRPGETVGEIQARALRAAAKILRVRSDEDTTSRQRMRLCPKCAKEFPAE